MKKIVYIVCMLMLLCSCNNRTVYTDFHSLPAGGWHQDSVLSYSISEADSSSVYEVLLLLRHTDTYGYQNLWLFVDEYVDSVLIHQDTIEAMLADEYGRWLGRGRHRYELPLLYDDSYYFSSSHTHTFRIRQGMRTDCLQGITEVGMIIQYKDGQE